MARRLVGKRRNVKAPQAHKNSLSAIVVGNAIGPVCVGDVYLDQDQVWLVVNTEWLHVLIHNDRFIIGSEVSGQGGQSQRWKQGILNPPPAGAGWPRRGP